MSSATLTKPANSLLQCAVCCNLLPLRLPRRDEKATDWTCTGCGSTMSAVFESSAPITIRNHAQPARSASQNSTASHEQNATRYAPSGTSQSAIPPRNKLVCHYQNSASREADAEIVGGHGLRHELRGESFSNRIGELRGAVPYNQRLADAMGNEIKASAAAIGNMFEALAHDRSPNMTQLPDIAENTLTRAAEDLDLFVALGLNQPGENPLSRHSMHSGMLAMSIAANMGWDESSLLDLGLGCLMHDAGMLKLEDKTYNMPKVLQLDEYMPILRHPIYTLDMLAPYSDVLPKVSRTVAYQLHERCDGSGYPRARTAESIHELAKIAAVADVFVALVSPRPHRDGLIPYFAIEQLLRDVKQGLFDPAVVRALLHTVSLFPLGSYVLLNDGRAGQVLRSNGAAFARPVVEITRRDGITVPRDVIDLTKAPELNIVRAVSSLSETL